jgi:hypothetical protein
MPRRAVLNDEQVFLVRNNPYDKKLKEFSADFGVSVPTIINAKKGREPYGKPFSKEFEDAMVAKHFHG